MRILQVLPHLSKGGAERVVVDLSNSLVEVGNEVTVLLAFPVDPSLNQQYLDQKVKVQFVSRKIGNRALQYLKLPFWVLKHWKSLKTYDVIHCHLTFGLIFGFIVSLFRKVGREKSPKLVATCHMVGVGGALRVMNEWLSNYFDSFVLMAQDVHWRQFIEDKKKTNIQVIANGISSNKKDLANKTTRNSQFFTVGTISRLNAERKPWLFLQVFSEILKAQPTQQLRFIIGGDGLEREKLEQMSEELGLSQYLTFTGLVRNPNDFLKQLDLYISLNVEGISGIAGLEAVFAGIPVVAIQLSPEYPNGSKDWIWSDQQTPEVAKKILELAKDSKKIQDLARGQLLFASTEYSSQHMADGYLKVYEK